MLYLFLSSERAIIFFFETFSKIKKYLNLNSYIALQIYVPSKDYFVQSGKKILFFNFLKNFLRYWHKTNSKNYVKNNSM